MPKHEKSSCGCLPRNRVGLVAIMVLMLAGSLFLVAGRVNAAASLDFSLPDSAGKMVSAQAFRGREVFLFVFSYECRACRTILPELNTLAPRMDKGAALLGVVYGATPAAAAKGEVNFPVLSGDRRLREDWAIRQTPTMLWFDAQGRLRDRFVGRGQIETGLRLVAPRQREIFAGLVELQREPARFIGRKVQLTGMLKRTAGNSRGEGADFVLSNDNVQLKIQSWAALPSVPTATVAPTPTPMEQWLGKNVVIIARVRQLHDKIILENAEIVLDEK